MREYKDLMIALLKYLLAIGSKKRSEGHFKIECKRD
jgi:hypothetical protein